MKSLFVPFHNEGGFTLKFIAFVQIVILLGLWFAMPVSSGIPNPISILGEWNRLALEMGLLRELFTSTVVIWQAIALSMLISTAIAALQTADLMKPFGAMIGSFRFLGFAGLTFLFTLWTNSAHDLKLLLLTFGMTVFQTRSAIDIANSITTAEVDYARSLGLSGWRITWEMILRGKLPDLIDLTRQNAAVGWALLAMVEGITRSEGGIGALLLNQNKYFNLTAVFAIQLTILSYGLLQDYALQILRKIICPYTELTRGKS